MFNLLFKKYKLELLDTNFIKDIKGIPTYAKIFLAILILCSILSPVFGLMRWNIASLITIAVLVINFFVLGILAIIIPTITTAIKPNINFLITALFYFLHIRVCGEVVRIARTMASPTNAKFANK